MKLSKSTLLRPTVVLLAFATGLRADAAGEETGNTGGGSPAPAQSSYQPLTGRERINLYLHDAFWSPGAFFRAAGPAAGAQMNNEPAAWGQGMEGYSKRFANRFGRYTLAKSFEVGAAEMLQHEVRYLPSNRTPNVSRVGGVIAAEFTGNLMDD